MEALSAIKKCKKCDSGYLDSRVKKPLLVKLVLSWLPVNVNVKRYRCDYCHKKTYLFSASYTRPVQHILR